MRLAIYLSKVKRFLPHLIAVLVGIFGVWLLYWPLMEAWYAWSWTPIVEKGWDMVLGLIIILVDFFVGIRVLF